MGALAKAASVPDLAGLEYMSFFPNPGDCEVHLYVVEWGGLLNSPEVFSHTSIQK